MHEWRGTRAELVSELRRGETGWTHFGKDELARQAREGRERLEAGQRDAIVGHVKYLVTED